MAEPEPATVVLVSDRLRYEPVVRTLAAKSRFWGYGSVAKDSDTPVKDILEDPPDLKRDAAIFVDLHPRHAERVADELKEAYPRVSLFLGRRTADGARQHKRYFVVDLKAMFRNWVAERREFTHVRERVEQLQSALVDARRILILTHPNPDPDAIASALGMRTVLGRNRQTATIGYLGRPLARPENLAMIELLEIDLKRVDESELEHYDAVVLVDCQENVFARYELPRIAAVIDHHPEQAQYEADFRDVVPEEGSTATIITRYLQALETEPSQRLATALLYGVKTDTFFLKREVNPDDIQSFMYLYPRSNVNLLRRIEDPEVPLDDIHLMGKALQQSRIENNVFLVGLDADVPGEDIVARLADYGLQVKGADWSLAYAPLGDSVIISVRNVGYVRHAGRAVDKAFGRFGPAGGHRSAARAILAVEAVEEALGQEWRGNLGDWLVELFSEELAPDD